MAGHGLKSVKRAGNTVVFTFSGIPGYQQFDFYRFNVAIVPQHIFSKYSNTDLTTGNLDKGKVVGSGPTCSSPEWAPSRRRWCGRRT